MLVEMVDMLDDAILPASRDGDVVEHRHVLDHLTQSDSSGMRAHRNPMLGGQQENGKFLVEPGFTREASTCTTSTAPACISCLNITRSATCSPVATLIGWIARRITACPSTSSGLVGSSIQYGSYDHRTSGHVDDALLGTQPAQVRLVDQFV
jgi:hypothetical protein